MTEETGLEVRILAPVGDVEYWFVRGGRRIHKTVHYFLMEATGGDLADHDHEFERSRWFDLSEAEALMSYPTERDIVARALPVAGISTPAGAAATTHGTAARRSRDRGADPDRPARAPRRRGRSAHDFGGWEMPVQYGGILEEHARCGRPPACSTCRTWASCGSAARTRRRRSRRALTNDPRPARRRARPLLA